MQYKSINFKSQHDIQYETLKLAIITNLQDIVRDREIIHVKAC